MFILGVSNYDASKFCKGAYLAKTCTQCNPHDDIIELAASSNNSNKQANAAAIRGSTIFGCTPTARTMVIMPFIMLVSRSDIPTSRPSDIPSKSALHEGERCKALTLFELNKLPAIINWGIERAGRQCTCTISHATFLQKCSLLCDSTQEIMRHLHAYTTQLALLDMYASLAHVRHRGQTYQLASGMLGARREGPANAPTSQAATRRCRNSRRLATRHMLNARERLLLKTLPRLSYAPTS